MTWFFLCQMFVQMWHVSIQAKITSCRALASRYTVLRTSLHHALRHFLALRPWQRLIYFTVKLTQSIWRKKKGQPMNHRKGSKRIVFLVNRCFKRQVTCTYTWRAHKLKVGKVGLLWVWLQAMDPHLLPYRGKDWITVPYVCTSVLSYENNINFPLS